LRLEVADVDSVAAAVYRPWVPFYNFLEPALFGFPFFYWYQLAWVPISSLLIWLVYRSQPHDEAP
jgi:hypothetical protein